MEIVLQVPILQANKCPRSGHHLPSSRATMKISTFIWVASVTSAAAAPVGQGLQNKQKKASVKEDYFA